MSRLLNELLTVFLAEFPGWWSNLKAAVECKDCEQIRTISHTIKGSMGQFGAQAGYAAALRLELAGKRGGFSEETQEAFKQLDGEVERLMPAIAMRGAGSKV